MLVLALSLFSAVPTYAITAPDSTPQVERFNVYRNLLETGDMLLLIMGNIPYATTPVEFIWQTYSWRLFKADNVTEVGAALPYAFNDNGYGYNLVSMYFNAANVTASGIIWGSALNVKLSGNPSANYTSLPEYNYNIGTADYSVLTTSADVKAELAARLLTIATELDTRWGLGSAYSLLSETETGTVLSLYGEAYFRGVIYGLQGLCPQVFAYVVSDLDLTPRTWTTTYITVLKNQYVGTWVDTAKNALDALFGTSYSLAWLLLSVLGCFAVLIITAVVSGDTLLGVMDFFFAAIIFTRLGFIDLGFMALACAVAVIYDSSRLWGVFK